MSLLAAFKFVPSWCYWLLALVALCLGCEMHGRHAVRKQWDVYIVAQSLISKTALDKRNDDNASLKKIQIGVSENIQKVNENEIINLRATIAQSKRLRIGSAICGGATGQAHANSATSGDAADTSGRLLSDEMDRDIKSLILETEQAAATGRAAQAFIRKNGLDGQALDR